jgi:DNA polymerase III subunit delta
VTRFRPYLAEVTPEDMLIAASAQSVPPVVLVIGAEQYLQGQVWHAVRASVLKNSVPGLNEDIFTATEVPVDTIIGTARTLPMLAKRRLVAVRQIERWEANAKGNSDALDRIAQYSADPVPSTVLVLSGAKLDGRKRLATMAKKGNWLVTCEPIARAAIPGFIAAKAKQKSARITPSAAELILEVTGTDLAAITDAIERLCLYVGPDGVIDEDAVGTCLARVKTSTVWELVGAIGHRDLGRALAALDAVYDPKDRGLPIVGTMAWSARQLLRFEAALRSGRNPAEAAQQAGAPPFRANELADQCRRLTRADLERWLEVISGIDVALKGASKRPPRAVLEHAVLSMCRTSRSQRTSTRSPA